MSKSFRNVWYLQSKNDTAEFSSDLSGDDDVKVSEPSRERPAMRAASKKIVYKFDSDQEDDDSKKSGGFSDSDSDVELKPTNVSSDDMFNSLKEADNGPPAVPVAAGASKTSTQSAKRKLNKPPAIAKVTKRSKKADSDDDEMFSSKKVGHSFQFFFPFCFEDFQRCSRW